MARHKTPQRTRRRLIAAGMAAVAILGTAVYVGILGNASAKDTPVAGAGNQQCLPENPGASGSQTAPPETSAPQDSSVPSEPPTEPPSEPPAEPPAETPTEAPTETSTEPPAEPAPQPEPEPAPAETPTETLGFAKPLALQPTEPAAPPADTSGAPAEQGPAPAETPDPQPQAENVDTFGAPDCAEALGPFPEDFVDIRRVRPKSLDARPQRGASRGTFVSRCGTNQNGHNNPDNFIVAPGVRNGAHHLHDYVGNLSADGNSTNESLQAAGTTCRAGDKSTYFWPVIRLRDRNGGGAADAENPHNIGRVIRPSSVTLQFRGNATGDVVAMPGFLRVLTGDAKASINGGANGNARWTCSGFTNRFTTKYPLCPRGSQLQRVLEFPGCWDGTNIDSANHRTHVAFPDRRGACPQGMKAIPQLRMTLTYNVPRGPVFAVDAFPEVKHSPTTDHGDFVNVMPEQLMSRVVGCINGDRNC